MKEPSSMPTRWNICFKLWDYSFYRSCQIYRQDGMYVTVIIICFCLISVMTKTKEKRVVDKASKMTTDITYEIQVSF